MRKDMVSASHKQELRSNSLCSDILRISDIESFSDNLKALAKLNSSWNLAPDQIVANGKANKKIYKIKFTNSPVRFSSAEDIPGTTYVLVCDKIIGILNQENTSKLKKLIASSEIHNVTCIIQGGLYKIVDPSYNVTIHQQGISAAIKIVYQSQNPSAGVSVPSKKEKSPPLFCQERHPQ